ncbi:sensor histidine kinase [Marinomonas posidonica]|uniref:sensor histidine kinase n=1 Tax=Marinomonas posidonica TaxID=936476 RepID=UPI001494A9B8|nr:MFS domain-containing histidine kinase [Marinomonas posidonica]
MHLEDSALRYDLNSAPQASGLFICPANMEVSDILTMAKVDALPIDTTTRPNFKKHPRYCFYLQVRNETDYSNWVLHFSNLFINSITLLVADETHVERYQSDLSQGLEDEHINVIGRGFSVQLLPERTYTLAIELNTEAWVAPPYFALMNERQYRLWHNKLGRVFNISIGVIIGLVVIALLCALVLRDATFFWFGVSSLLLLFFFIIRSDFGIYLLNGPHELPVWLWGWASATLISLLLFARSFLLVGATQSKLYRFFVAAVVLSCFSFVLSFYLSRNENAMLYMLNGVAMVILLLYAGRVKQKEHGRFYLLFMLGWLPVLYSFVRKGAVLSVAPEPFVSTLSYNILQEPFLQILHMLIHFFALLVRIMYLKKQKYQAELQNEAKSRFLASVSHDLRQPLHSMSIFLAHLEEHITSQAGRVLLSKAYGLHSSMNDSFKKLMDLSRLEAGAVQVHREHIALDRVIEKMRAEFEPYARDKGLKLRIHLSQRTLFCDSEHFERILRNLISNALKYTQQGGVLVCLRGRKEHLLIQVWDTGCGITQDEQLMIFDIYSRSEKVADRHTGMGIGLAIVKQLVELLGGEISLRSVENQGSMFQVRLPIVNDATLREEVETPSNQRFSLQFTDEFSSPQLAEQVLTQLKRWGYPVTEKEVNTQTIKRDNRCVLVLTDLGDSSDGDAILEQIKAIKKRFDGAILAVFLDEIARERLSQRAELDVHVLPRNYRPAQLRSLIRYLESALKI